MNQQTLSGPVLGGQRAAATHRKARRRFDIGVAPLIVTLRAKYRLSLSELADELNLREIPSRRGGRWHPRQVLRVLQRAQEAPGIELDDGRLGIIRREASRF
jgi:hypothetical protein